MNYGQDILVSIIMPAYNAGRYIEESIQSVIHQTFKSWELIIIDDCSTDNTIQLVQQYVQRDRRIKLYRFKQNSGVALARNKGIALANGRYIAFLDSDDIWLPKKLTRQIEFMIEKQAAITYTQYRQFTHSVLEYGNIIDVSEKLNYEQLLKGNVIGCLTVMIDRKIIPDICMPVKRHEDYITWLNLLRNGNCAYGLKEDLARYRKSVNSLSGNKLKSMKWTWNVYRKSQNLSIVKASYYFCHYVLKSMRKHY